MAVRSITFDDAEWQLVPKQPTEPMIRAGVLAFIKGPRNFKDALNTMKPTEDRYDPAFASLYRGMLEEAPKPE